MDADQSLSAAQQSAHRAVLVWDLPVRLFHWSVVVLVVAAYVTIRLNWMDWHVRIGETLLALVLFRLLWGCFGSETARFRSFWRRPLPRCSICDTCCAAIRTCRWATIPPARGWCFCCSLYY